MTDAEFSRYDARVRYYGFTPEEAFHCPPNKPLWMYRLEKREGMSFEDIAKREFSKIIRVTDKRKRVRDRKPTVADFAQSINEEYFKVFKWVTKLRAAGKI